MPARNTTAIALRVCVAGVLLLGWAFASRPARAADTDWNAGAASWFQIGNWTNGDYNGDTTVDDLDLAQLLNNWGAGVPIEAVPEPGFAVLLLICLPWVLRRRAANP